MCVGYLGPVSGLTGAQTSSNEAVFKWSKPYSLEGVPVLGYQVHAVVVDSISGHTISYNNAFLNKTNFTITKTVYVSCTHVNITVLAISNVGPGQETDLSFRFIESKLHFVKTVYFLLTRSRVHR